MRVSAHRSDLSDGFFEFAFERRMAPEYSLQHFNAEIPRDRAYGFLRTPPRGNAASDLGASSSASTSSFWRRLPKFARYPCPRRHCYQWYRHFRDDG
jgi:hypothetical protein